MEAIPFLCRRNVRMEMEYGLACLFTGINDKAEAVFLQSFCFGNLFDDEEKVSKVFIVFFIKCKNVIHMLLRDHQNMNRCAGFNIPECEPVVILINFCARNFSGSTLQKIQSAILLLLRQYPRKAIIRHRINEYVVHSASFDSLASD